MKPETHIYFFLALSHRQPAKAQASLYIRAAKGSDQKSDIYRHWMAEHVCLKNEFTEDEKYHNLMRWLKWIVIWTPKIVLYRGSAVPQIVFDICC